MRLITGLTSNKLVRGITRVFFITLLAFSVSGCDKCDIHKILPMFDECDEPTSATVRDIEAEIDTALENIRDFRNKIASEAGDNSVSLRSLQTAELGDVFILNEQNDSVIRVDAFPTDSDIRTTNDLNTISVTVVWYKEYGFNHEMDLTLPYVVIKTIFENSEVHKVGMTLSVADASLDEFQTPNSVKQAYENQNSEGRTIPGNIFVTGLVKARTRVAVTAYDSNDQVISLNTGILVQNINNLPEFDFGYAEEVTGYSATSLIQESTSSQTVFSIVYLPISEYRQNTDFINAQLPSGNATENVTEASIIMTLVDENGDPAVAYKVTQVRKTTETDENVEWSLVLENVSGSTWAYGYTIDIYDQSNDLRVHYDGQVLDFHPGFKSNEIFLSDDPLPINFANIVIKTMSL